MSAGADDRALAEKPPCRRRIASATLAMVVARWSRVRASQLALLAHSDRNCWSASLRAEGLSFAWYDRSTRTRGMVMPLSSMRTSRPAPPERRRPAREGLRWPPRMPVRALARGFGSRPPCDRAGPRRRRRAAARREIAPRQEIEPAEQGFHRRIEPAALAERMRQAFGKGAGADPGGSKPWRSRGRPAPRDGWQPKTSAMASVSSIR